MLMQHRFHTNLLNHIDKSIKPCKHTFQKIISLNIVNVHFLLIRFYSDSRETFMSLGKMKTVQTLCKISKTYHIFFHTMPFMQNETVALIKHVLTKSTPVYSLSQIHTIKTHKASNMLFKGIPLGQAAHICLCVVWNIRLACESTKKKEGLRCSCQTPSKHTGSRLAFYAECVYI